MLKYALVQLGSPRRMGQAATASLSPFHVSVVDKRGNPFGNAQILIRTGSGGRGEVYGYTDARGTATFPSVPDGDIEVVAVLENGMKVTQKGHTKSDMFIEIPVCAPVPFLTKTELVVLVGGAALAGAGYLTKAGTLEVVGELIFGGGVFSAIYRNSCAW